MITLPSWKECARAIENNRGTPLHLVIYYHEANGLEDTKWREYLTLLIKSFDITPVKNINRPTREFLDGTALRSMGAFLRGAGFPQAAVVLELKANETDLLNQLENKNDQS